MCRCQIKNLDRSGGTGMGVYRGPMLVLIVYLYIWSHTNFLEFFNEQEKVQSSEFDIRNNWNVVEIVGRRDQND